MPYLVDGHNLLGQIPGLSLKDPADRRRLVSMLAAFARAKRGSVTVIFDGSPPPGLPAESRVGRVRILHAGGARSADDVLLETIRRSKAPADLTLVTSDRRLFERGRHLGARAMAGHRFRRIMEEAAARSGGSTEKPERPDPDEIDYFLEAFGSAGDAPDRRSSRRR